MRGIEYRLIVLFLVCISEQFNLTDKHHCSYLKGYTVFQGSTVWVFWPIKEIADELPTY